MPRVDLRAKKPKPKMAEPEPEEKADGYLGDMEDEFGDIIPIEGDKEEAERVTRYLVDDSDIEGKSFVDKGEKPLFTMVKRIAQNPKFATFHLEEFPHFWLHLALGEKEGRGRAGALNVLKGRIELGAPKENPMDGG